MPRLNLPLGSLFFHAATVLHGKNLAILIFFVVPAFSCADEREREYRIHCCCFEPCGYGSAAGLVYGYFELDDITQLSGNLSRNSASFSVYISFMEI